MTLTVSRSDRREFSCICLCFVLIVKDFPLSDPTQLLVRADPALTSSHVRSWPLRAPSLLGLGAWRASSHVAGVAASAWVLVKLTVLSVFEQLVSQRTDSC